MHNSSWAIREAREAFAVSCAKWFTVIGLVLVSIIAWVEYSYAGSNPATATYRGEIPGYLVTINVEEPTACADGVYNVNLCPPTSGEGCRNGIAGSRFMSWGENQWFVSINAKESPSEAEFLNARTLLNEAMRTVCKPNPACAAADGQAI